MHIVRDILDLRRIVSAYKQPSYVPTIGNLHDGHLLLVKAAQGTERPLLVEVVVRSWTG